MSFSAEYAEIFAFAFFGGFATNILNLAELSRMPPQERPRTFSDPFYWFQFIGLPLLAGVLGYAYHRSGTELSPIVAMNVGASAPLILRSFAAAVPAVTRKIG